MRLTTIYLFAFCLLLSCKKESSNQECNTPSLNSLLIKRDNIDYREYFYSSTGITTFYDFENSTRKEYDYVGDSIVVRWFNKNSEQELKEVFHKSETGEVIVANRYRNFEEQRFEQLHYQYENEKLSKVIGYLPQTFRFRNGNVIQHGRVAPDSPKWTENTLYYSDYANPFNGIKKPDVEVAFLSRNAISMVVQVSEEPFDNMGMGQDSMITISDTLYTASFELDNSGNIVREVRSYNSETHVYEYIHSTY